MDITLLSAYIDPALGAGAAFLATLALTPLVIRLARRMGWLAYPEADRWHSEPTALMGGLALFGAATVGVVATGPADVPWMVWGGATLMFIAGLVDDLREVRPAAKLVAQIAATALLLAAGYVFAPDWSVWVSVPLTFLWVIGITNSINLLDNMDGLAAGIAGVAALTLVAFAALVRGEASLSVAAAVGGAAAGFLIFNFKPARIFMGDCGSLFLGYIIAALALMVAEHAAVMQSWSAAYLIPLAVLAVPIFDTTLVTFARKLAGRPISKGGRDHSSHRLVFLGLSERQAVLMLYGLSAGTGGLALLALFVDVMLFHALVVFAGVGLVVLGIHLGRASVYQEGTEGASGERSDIIKYVLRTLHAVFGRSWKAVFGVAADLGLVGAAYIAAHYLRFEQGLPSAQRTLIETTLPLVVTINLVIFYGMGLYRGIWRHAGTNEMLRLVGATTGATMAVGGALALLYGPTGFSRAALVIHWMIVTLAVAGARFGFRGLRQFFASQRDGERRALLFGAGDAGHLALREIRQNPDRDLEPIGFIDDDSLKQGQRVQGLSVLGPGEELPALCKEHDIDVVLITAVRIAEERRQDIHALCRTAGVECRVFDLSFAAPAAEKTAANGESQKIPKRS